MMGPMSSAHLPVVIFAGVMLMRSKMKTPIAIMPPTKYRYTNCLLILFWSFAALSLGHFDGADL